MKTKVCKACGEEKVVGSGFHRSGFYKGEQLYKNKCIECITIDNNGRLKIKREPITKEQKRLNKREQLYLKEQAIEFVKKVNKQRGWIDEIDCYRLAHHYMNVCGELNSKSGNKIFQIEDDLIIMWDKLKGLEK
jgi:hypothetical protein